MMRILLVHNFYQQPGGEDLVYADEARLLEARGHDVVRYSLHNDTITSMSTIGLVGRTVWNAQSNADIRARIAATKPDLLHVHNTFPLVSPSVYYAASASRLPVVQTLHNYRLFCPAAVCFRDGRVCTDCLDRSVPWPAVRHACYRDSRMASATVVTTLSIHRLLRTWQRKVAAYVALTNMARSLFIRAGLPGSKIVVKPNFVDPDPGPGAGEGGYMLFIGRLSAEKGLRTLLRAWQLLPQPVPLRIVGDGPLASELKAAAGSMPEIQWLGRREPAEIVPLLRDATCLVFPSECYETFGRVIVEAFAAATPVIAAGHGAAAELVRDGGTGLLFRPGDAEDLASKVMLLCSEPSARGRLSAAARVEFEVRYTADVNYRSLMDIYNRAVADAERSSTEA
jgi:glycosyltransferase involved in cell wall biosynthesis